MFFSGDSSARKRVDLGGRSSKERDRQKLLEQTRLERNRRLWLRQQNSAAIKIQKCFRGRKAVEAERLRVREHFFMTYGKRCQNVDRHSFGLDSDFLRQLLFFFNPQNVADFSALVETCRLLQQFVRESAGGILSLFAGVDYSSKYAVVDYRVKQLAYACIRGVHQNRNQLKDQLFMTSDKSSTSTILLLEAVVMLIDPGLPWSCKIVGYLLQRNTYYLLREIVLTGKESIKFQDSVGKISSLESILALIIPHVGQRSCVCANIDPRWSFSSQILTIPFLWKLFPYLKEIFATRELSVHYIHQMALCVQNHANVLPNDIATEFPGYACLLGNLLETAGVAFSQPDCSFDMAIDFAAVATFLLEALPPMQSSNKESKEVDEDEIIVGDEMMEKGLNKDLELQISNAIDPRFLLQLTNVLFGRISFVNGSYEEGAHGKEVVAVGAACAFLHVTFNILPLERVMTVLAYRTELVPVIWKFMKRCHENQMWSALSGQLSYLPGDAPGWLLPLSVFCPVYKHMLMIVDNEEFYEQEKPLSIKDIKCLVVILRQALWQLLWVNPVTPPNPAKCTADVFTLKRHPLEFIQHRVSIVASDLLSQLQDWNNRRQFTAPSDFHADGVNDHFISQAMIENSRAHEILKHAPFLVPFTSRVKIFTSQLAAARQRHGPHAVFTRNRFRIRRDHILEDAFSQLSALSEEDLRGPIRVTFVNGFGVEEAGIDGGGIFKDFMENITRAAFDVQYGLFKETVDHLLYPNPGSGMIHEQHLQFFHFLGTVLAKAMFEGILVDIPFATFFLSKLKQKYNYLNDLPSLDPELYRHLIFLKHYEGDTSKLELYFVIVNNEYGEQTEEELLPGGKSIRVTNENVITFIHLIANHRLNSQIRQQSSHFLRGFQQLIQKDWIDMFNEHELQLLISGSLDGFDVEDLRAHTNYAGGYHSEHYVIDMLWAVLKNFSMENQMKFLKFVTGCSRGPLLGFKYLEPLFCIQRAAGNASEEALDRLPTSATCMNLLKLPPYRSKEQMEQKLLYAINADAGFDLS
ncbi:E3 ubiquitin-protein ligase UPL6-like isoform X1 [Camellia sinensis]|uniref:E3 ubiquitin-protein ligase UPL6-like isoform X1 n=1 Tax=Camellia sinensis TaxID=4442 RepID=UPI001035CFE1|nr:E3 ubiquitin-protein ligase UPL6-like isoform X1 [Camellia sinensis]